MGDCNYRKNVEGMYKEDGENKEEKTTIKDFKEHIEFLMIEAPWRP